MDPLIDPALCKEFTAVKTTKKQQLCAEIAKREGVVLDPSMVFDVQVNVGDKVHFYSPYLYDLYLTGGFHVGGIMSHPKMSGGLQVKRGGTINYLKTEFKIREGRATFNQVASFMPFL